ncbi:MAG: permease [Verrucomicrobiales bacterium]
MEFSNPAFHDVARSFISILLEGAPYILLGTLISGFIDAYLPKNAMDRLLPKNRVLAIFVSGLLGAIFPVCECAIVPVIRRLVKKGLPVACAVTYMLSAPIINPITVVSTYSAFKGVSLEMTLSRLFMAYIVTVFVGLLIHRIAPKKILSDHIAAELPGGGVNVEPEVDTSPVVKDTEQVPGGRLIHALRTAQTDFLETGMYFVIGVIIAATFSASPVLQDLVRGFASNDFIAVPGMMIFAFILSLCSTTDAFIIAADASLSLTSKLAFLVYGPMMDVKLLFLYSSVFKKKFVLFLVFGLFILIGLLCIPWSIVLELPQR